MSALDFVQNGSIFDMVGFYVTMESSQGSIRKANYVFSNFYSNDTTFQKSNFCGNFITFLKVSKWLITN